MRNHIDLGLSDREKFFIAEIISQWGALEHEIFVQTLASFGADEKLPKQMNNLQFSEVLSLWILRVVEPLGGSHREALGEVGRRIEALQDYRNALVHGMWSWDISSPSRVVTTRVKRDQVIRTIFTADDLQKLALQVSDIHFQVRYPGGTDDLVEELMQTGFSASRGFIAMMTGDPVHKDLYPPGSSANGKPNSSDPT